MQFSGKEDIEAPIDDVFAMVSEFETFERSAIRRGIEVQRGADCPPGGAGMNWHTRFYIRGKLRDMHVKLIRYDTPSLMEFTSTSKGVDGLVIIELLALSPRRTRLSYDFTLTAKTLAARLFLHSMKLARKNMTRRFNLRFAEFARDLEERRARRA
ncbi:MAG: SRPBCC family protein [Pseudomonadota bacterium]